MYIWNQVGTATPDQPYNSNNLLRDYDLVIPAADTGCQFIGISMVGGWAGFTGPGGGQLAVVSHAAVSALSPVVSGVWQATEQNVISVGGDVVGDPSAQVSIGRNADNKLVVGVKTRPSSDNSANPTFALWAYVPMTAALLTAHLAEMSAAAQQDLADSDIDRLNSADDRMVARGILPVASGRPTYITWEAS